MRNNRTFSQLRGDSWRIDAADDLAAARPQARRLGHRLGLTILTALMLLVTACGTASPGADTPVVTDTETDVVVETEPAPAGDRLKVLASFYPLQFVAQQVGGEYVEVSNLTPPAAEPHDLELSLAQARTIGTADVVVILGGFQAAVDEAVEQQSPARLVDAANYVTLLSADDTGAMAEEDEEDAAEEEHGHAHELAGMDPHFWLDPTQLALLADPVATALSEADPAHAEQFEQNAASLKERLAALDQEFTDRLAPFHGSMLVTNHTAFGYLARRYGLEQVGIAGLDPETEPSPARMREIADLARDHDVKTLFYESLVSPRVVQTLADDLGIQVAELNPIEGLGEAGATENYFTLMERNLDTLVEGLSAP